MATAEMTFEDVVSNFGFDKIQTAQIVSRLFAEIAQNLDGGETVGEVLGDDQLREFLVKACHKELEAMSTTELCAFEMRAQTLKRRLS